MESPEAAPYYWGIHDLAGNILTTRAVGVYEEDNISYIALECDMDFDVHNSSEVEKRIHEFTNSQIYNHSRLDARLVIFLFGHGHSAASPKEVLDHYTTLGARLDIAAMT